jgi:Dolichyl-phosphate-mannose-protein mannosyltransferase
MAPSKMMVRRDVTSGSSYKCTPAYNFFVSSEKFDARGRFAAPWVVFWVALAVRLAYVMLAHSYRMRPYDDHFGFGWEMGRIARALVTGYGYADPFRGHTGPTTWVTPGYPLIIAGVFRLFGIFTPLSAWVLVAINCVLNALMVRTTWEIAARCFNTSVARWSAWIWALYPAAMQYAVKWIWEMSLTAFLFSWVLVLALRMRAVGGDEREGASVKRWVVFGLLWGLIALSNPSLLLFLPVCGLWILWGVLLRTATNAGASRSRPLLALTWGSFDQWRLQIVGVALASVVCLACIAPWVYRNWVVFHQFVPMRANLGAELYLGNGPGAIGLLMEYDHPFQDAAQLRLYSQMGEIKYAKLRGDMAKAVIRENPKHFLILCAKRVYYFWFSVPHPGDEGLIAEYGRSLNFQLTSITGLLGLALALKRHVPGAVLFAWAFLLLPLVYYAVTVHARFRHPLEPLIAILSVYLFQSAKETWRVRWLGSA